MNDRKNIMVRRSPSEYSTSILWVISGIIAFSIQIAMHRQWNFTTILFLIVATAHGLNLIMMHFRPYIKLESDKLIIYQYIFERKTIFRHDIKQFMLFKETKKWILSQKQQKQNNTLLIDLVNDQRMSFVFNEMTKTVRQNIINFASENNFPLVINNP